MAYYSQPRPNLSVRASLLARRLAVVPCWAGSPFPPLLIHVVHLRLLVH